MNWILYLAAAASGAANPAQAGANAELRKTTGNALFSALIVYASGLLFILMLQLIARHTLPPGSKLVNVPWWAWLGGLLSIVSTLAGITLAQKMGSGTFTGLTLTASVVMSIIFDNFGWIGFAPHPASWPRMAGGALMIAGLWLVSQF